MNKVLQFSRTKFNMERMLLPMGIIFVFVVILLVLWTVLSDFGWHREVIDEETGESFGSCSSDCSTAWFAGASVTALLPAVMTLVMAWKTKDVDDSFSEAWWIFSLIFIQIQVSTLDGRRSYQFQYPDSQPFSLQRRRFLQFPLSSF